MNQRRVVLELIIVLQIGRVANKVSTVVECTQHLNGRGEIIRQNVVRPAIVLKSRFVHQGAVHVGLNELRGVISVPPPVPERLKIKASDARFAHVRIYLAVADAGGIGIIQLVIDPRTYHPAPLDGRHGAGEWIRLDRLRVQGDGIHD
jgi:hypothetical protein